MKLLSLILLVLPLFAISCKRKTNDNVVPRKDSATAPVDSLKTITIFYHGSTVRHTDQSDSSYNDGVRVDVSYHTMLHAVSDSGYLFLGSPYVGQFTAVDSGIYYLTEYYNQGI